MPELSEAMRQEQESNAAMSDREQLREKMHAAEAPVGVSSFRMFADMMKKHALSGLKHRALINNQGERSLRFLYRFVTEILFSMYQLTNLLNSFE